MKNRKKIIAGCAVVLALAGTSATALAASSYDSPAAAAAGLTGKTVTQIYAEHHAGKSYGAIAAGAGKLQEFHQSVLNLHKDALASRVADGTQTQEQADADLAALEQRQAACDGTGYSNTTNSSDSGYGSGSGYGNGSGYGHGQGHGNSYGGGHGNGHDMGAGHNSSCQYQ